MDETEKITVLVLYPKAGRFGEFWRVTRNGRGASNSPKPLILNGEPCRIRTYDPLIKRTPKKLNNT